MNPRVVKVLALNDYELELLFDNGERGMFSMQPYLDYPVYRPLRDKELFSKAKIVFGSVAWSSDIDMSPDNLYLECRMFAR
jgi:hypothetical protein